MRRRRPTASARAERECFRQEPDAPLVEPVEPVPIPKARVHIQVTHVVPRWRDGIVISCFWSAEVDEYCTRVSALRTTWVGTFQSRTPLCRTRSTGHGPLYLLPRLTPFVPILDPSVILSTPVSKVAHSVLHMMDDGDDDEDDDDARPSTADG